MNNELRTLKSLEIGTQVTLFTRFRDKSKRPTYRWNGKAITGLLIVGQSVGDAVLCSGIPLHADMLIRC
jgi:hypothetical protein